MFDQFISKKEKIAVVGLGYVGLPLAVEFAKQYPVIGFDISSENLRVITYDVGGGFGMKSQPYSEYAAILFAASLIIGIIVLGSCFFCLP